jgi:hypothetical protein
MMFDFLVGDLDPSIEFEGEDLFVTFLVGHCLRPGMRHRYSVHAVTGGKADCPRAKSDVRFIIRK